MGDNGLTLLAYATTDAAPDPGAGRSWFEAAYVEGEQTGDIEVMAEAVLGLCGPWVHGHRTAAGSRMIDARLRHVRSLVDPASTLGLRLRVRSAAESDYRRGEHAAVMESLLLARASADPRVRMEALSLAHHCLLGPGHGAERRALADELIGEAGRAGHQQFLAMGLLWLVTDLLLDGDPHAHRRLGELRTVLSEVDTPAVEFVVAAIDVMLAIRAGRLTEAEQLAQECRERGVKVGDADADGWYGAQMVAIRWYQGRLPELLPLLEELVHSPTLSAIDTSFVAGYAVAAAQAGDGRAAASALAMLRNRHKAGLPRSSSWLVTVYGAIEAAHVLGNARASARAYELLRPYADLPMMASLAVACFGSVQHALGVAALTMGDLARAAEHLREAVHRNLALGHWPAVITSRRRYADVLERLGQAALAAEQRAEAAAVAQTLGALEPPANRIGNDRADGGPIEGGRHAGSLIGGGLVGGGLVGGGPIEGGGHAVLRRHGTRWRVDLGTYGVVVDHSVGMLHLAVLTANPGAEIAATDLAAGVGALSKARPAATGPQPVLDRAAVAQYRQRLAVLRDQIDNLEADGDKVGAARAHAERDWLLAELGATAGLGGRTRAFADGRERARLAVGRAIRRAIGHIEKADAAIGAHLRACVHTGASCWYRPL